MPKSLADLRANPPTSRPERSLTLCLAPHLVAEVQTLTEELTALTTGGPRRNAESLRVGELRTRVAELLDEMAESEGELRIRATRTDGEWRRWVNEHPAREKDAPGFERDQRVTAGYCNADDLLEDLSPYTVEWNDEPLKGDDFEAVIAPSLASADKAQIAQAVVALYESRLDFPRLRSSLSASLERLSDFGSASPSGSPTSGSTGGSHAPSSEASTETANPAA